MATIFVDANANGENNGSSWDNAYTRLQDALANAEGGDQVWIADGTYRPTTGSERGATFTIPDDVKVYGGFAGGEESLSDRDIAENVAILSGDIGTTEERSDNVYHVVTLNNVTRDTLLDGVTITGGNASESFNANSAGGGIYAIDSSATLSNLIITDNNARSGGGMYSSESQHQISNVEFLDNTTFNRGNGAGLYTLQSIDSLDNVVFGYNSAAGSGGGILNDRSTLSLEEAEFIANRAGANGGAIFNGTSNTFNVSDSVFLNNSAIDNGGGIYNDRRFSAAAEYRVDATIFKGNVAGVGGGIYNNRTGEFSNVVTNSLFEDNYSRFGGGIYNNDSSPTIISSTFTNNLSQFGAGIGSEGSSDDQPSIINSIFWDNLSIFGQNPIYDNSSVTGVSFSIVEGGESGTENIDADPQFVNPENFDFRLTASSPAINAGTNDAFTNPDDATDLAGNERIIDGRVDIGAYEGAELDPVPTEPQLSEDAAIVFVDEDASGDNNGTSWNNAYTNLQTALTNAPFGSEIWVAQGTYIPSLDNREVSFQLRNTIALYGGFSGTETSRSQRNVELNETILSGEIGQGSDINDNSYHVVNASNVTPSAVLDGFTIRGGNSDDRSGFNATGGGIYSNFSQATLQNLSIRDNNATFGGGLFIEENSSHVLTNIDFVGNNSSREGGAAYSEGIAYFFDSDFRNNIAGTSGGAIYNSRANIYVEGSIFDANRASDNGGAIYFDDNFNNGRERVINSVFNNNDSTRGGAIYNFRSDAEGVNLTFANNEAEEGAAVYSAGRDDDITPEYFNSIFWDNEGTSDPDQIFNDGENTIVRNSIVEGGFPGQENLDVDPVFVNQEAGDLRIRATSPAINEGLNDVVIEEEDVAGRERIVGGTVDIGAYEFSEPYISVSDPEVLVRTVSGEPDEDQEATFTVRLVDTAGEAAAQDSEVTVDYRALANTAIAEDDYVATNGTLTFEPGETEKTVTVPVLSNTDTEETETFFLALSNVTSNIRDFDPRGTATITSVSDVVEISINDVSTIEGNEDTNLRFTVSLSEAAEQAVTVDFAVNDDVAVAGDDYTDRSGTLTFEPGETEKNITINIVGDEIAEEDETFNLNLSNPSSNARLADGRGIGTIVNDDIDLEGIETIELFRFRNTIFNTGTYVFVGAAERDFILQDEDLSRTFALDGIPPGAEPEDANPAFVASTEDRDGLIPFFRLESLTRPGTFLFVSTAEYDFIFNDPVQSEQWKKQGFDPEDDTVDIPEFYLIDNAVSSGTQFTRFQNLQNNTFLYAGPAETAAIEADPNLSGLFLNQNEAFKSL